MTFSRSIAFVVACSTAVLVAGCGGIVSPKVPTGGQMIGVWSGSGFGYEQGKNRGAEETFFITKAAGQSFSGYKRYNYKDGRTGKELIHGAIASNGNISIVDRDGYYVNGSLKNGKMELQYIEASPEESEAANMSFVKQ